MDMKTGAIKDKIDNRDYILEALGSSYLTQEEWDKGFDIEEVLGFKLPVKNQYGSYSCVGQAYATYRAVRAIINKEVSAKSVYSLIAIGNNSGAFLRDGAKTLKNTGALLEKDLLSYKNNGFTDEPFMTDKSWVNDEIKKVMEDLKVEDYYGVTDFTIDGFAKAIRDGLGMVAGVEGNNNGTWFSVYPSPPKMTDSQGQIWGHAIFFGKFRMNNGKKEVGFLNSWGKECGDNGWQWLTEEWFKDNGRWIFNPWVLINKNKDTNMSNETAKILKDKNSKAVGIWLPAISEDVLKSYCLNMGKTLPMINGKIEWDKAIEGEFEYNK